MAKTCTVIVHRDGTTCAAVATHTVTNRAYHRPLVIIACERHASRYQPQYWRTAPIGDRHV